MQTMKQSKIKQNKKIVVIAITILTMLITTIPAYADYIYNNQSSDFTDQPLPYNVSDSADTVKLFTTVNGNGVKTSEGAYVTVNQDIYAVHVGSYFYFISQENIASGSVVCWRYEGFNGGKDPITTSSTTVNLDGQSYYYVTKAQASTTSNSTTTIFVPHYGSLTDAVNAVDDYINSQSGGGSGGETTTPQPLNITVQPGYILYANVENIDTVRYIVGTTTNIAVLPSTMIANNQYYGFADSIPNGNFNLPLNGSTSFPWNTQKTNIYGKGTNWQALGTLEPTGKYIFIVNPLVSTYRLAGVNGNTEVVDDATVNNGNIVVTLTSVNTSDVKLVPLNASYIYDPANGVEGINQGGNGDSPYNVTFDENGNPIYTDQNGNVINPPSGGNTDTSVPTMFGSITAWLENIAQQISGFFTGAVGAISTLISAGSAFVTQLSGLYSWLPPQVYSVLISGLILVITVGVIKVFL